MRLFLLLALGFPAMAAQLEIVRPLLSDTEGGAALPSGMAYSPGETMFFSCRIANYQKTPEEKIHLAYSVQAFDSKGAPLAELFKNDIMEEVGPQDKGWMPRIATEIPIPPLIASGTYHIAVHVDDLVAMTKADVQVPFEVRGHKLAPSESLTIENLQFFRSEEDLHPLEKAAYRAGDAVWTKFDITGFRYGPKNKIDISYVVSVLDGSGKVLWTQPEATTEQSESFYPKLWIPASMSITTQKNTHPGEYGIAIQVKDGIGNQTFEAKGTFTVE
jgi:hypothetical protein